MTRRLNICAQCNTVPCVCDERARWYALGCGDERIAVDPLLAHLDRFLSRVAAEAVRDPLESFGAARAAAASRLRDRIECYRGATAQVRRARKIRGKKS